MKVYKIIDIFIKDSELIRGFSTVYYNNGIIEEYNNLPIDLIIAQGNLNNAKMDEKSVNMGGTQITIYETNFITPIQYNPVASYFGFIRETSIN